LARNRNNESE